MQSDTLTQTLINLHHYEAELQHYIGSVDRVLRDLGIKQENKVRLSQSTDYPPEYVQFSRNPPKRTRASIVPEPTISVNQVEKMDGERLQDFLCKMHDWAQNLSRIEFGSSVYDQPLRARINQIYDAFGQTENWKKLFKKAFKKEHVSFNWSKNIKEETRIPLELSIDSKEVSIGIHSR